MPLDLAKLPDYTIDPRDPAGRYAHTVPVIGETFVKATGFSGFKMGTCNGLVVSLHASGKGLRAWSATITDGAEGTLHIGSERGPDWNWNEWHSLHDDAAARAALDDLDKAKAAVAAVQVPATPIVTPAVAKSRPTAPQA